jgi:hypothetical protein
MITNFDDLLKRVKIQNVSFDEFQKRLSVLDISDTTGTFAVRSDIFAFIERVARKETDFRPARMGLYLEKLYQMLVTDAEASLHEWYNRYVKLPEDVEFYLDLPDGNCLNDDTFMGMTNSKYGRLSKNLNFENFYNTKKLYSNDSEYVLGLLKAMYENFHIRNSLAGPAFFDHICKIEDTYGQVWTDFMMGANKASVFNPYTYKSILDTVFDGETLFAPVMGWNSYQQAFYSSKFKHFVATDVIPSVVENGKWLQQQYDRLPKSREIDNMFGWVDTGKTSDLYLCPSEQLDNRHDFVLKYKNKIDAILFSPPYFDLEIYPSENQSFDSFPDYDEWLKGYWEETVKLCKEVMAPNAKFGFVISNYRTHNKEERNISKDMYEVASKHLTFEKHYKVRWSAMSGSRQAKKQRDGNFEDLWIYSK